MWRNLFIDKSGKLYIAKNAIVGASPLKQLPCLIGKLTPNSIYI